MTSETRWMSGTRERALPEFGGPQLSATEDLARAIARFIAEAPASDPWAKYPPVLTVRHVAEVLGIEPRSVSEACRRGNLPMAKRLGRYVIDQVAFRAWLAGRSA